MHCSYNARDNPEDSASGKYTLKSDAPNTTRSKGSTVTCDHVIRVTCDHVVLGHLWPRHPSLVTTFISAPTKGGRGVWGGANNNVLSRALAQQHTLERDHLMWRGGGWAGAKSDIACVTSYTTAASTWGGGGANNNVAPQQHPLTTWWGLGGHSNVTTWDPSWDLSWDPPNVPLSKVYMSHKAKKA